MLRSGFVPEGSPQLQSLQTNAGPTAQAAARKDTRERKRRILPKNRAKKKRKKRASVSSEHKTSQLRTASLAPLSSLHFQTQRRKKNTLSRAFATAARNAVTTGCSVIIIVSRTQRPHALLSFPLPLFPSKHTIKEFTHRLMIMPAVHSQQCVPSHVWCSVQRTGGSGIHRSQRAMLWGSEEWQRKVNRQQTMLHSSLTSPVEKKI